MASLIQKVQEMQDLLIQQKESSSVETLVQSQSDVRAMTTQLARQAQVEADLRKEVTKLRVELEGLTEVRREKDLV